MLRLGIDASNIRSGGTVTHLAELLRAAEPVQHGFQEVIVWAGSRVLNMIEDKRWLRKVCEPLLGQAQEPFLDRRHLHRAYWQRFMLPRLARKASCDLLFVPGGWDNSGFRPLVTMSQNMLPFNLAELRRYGASFATLRLLLLRWLQGHTFRSADGLIFMAEHARDVVTNATKALRPRVAVIPHGISKRFILAPRRQRDIGEYSAEAPFKLLYVSTVDMYKHQWHVADAVARLRSSGLPVAIDLVGPANRRAMARLAKAMREVDASSEFIRYRGAIAYDELHQLYQTANLKVFASSCENMPNILLEAMAAGLPIACSNRPPMPEFLQDAGVYFDPENGADIAGAVEMLIRSPELRARLAAKAFEQAKQYSWIRCADETFSFLAQCARRSELVPGEA